jgi:nucleoid-associated protein YgaU
MRLRRVPDDAASARPRAPAATAPGAEGEIAGVHTVQGNGASIDGDGGLGERLDELAARLYGDPSQWRALANANGLDDPLHLQGGSVLQVPPQEVP